MTLLHGRHDLLKKQTDEERDHGGKQQPRHHGHGDATQDADNPFDQPKREEVRSREEKPDHDREAGEHRDRQRKRAQQNPTESGIGQLAL